MSRITDRRADAVAIWNAGVAAVDSERLVREAVRVVDGTLTVAGHRLPLAGIGRIAVVGAGKAGAGMAAGLEAALGDELLRERVVGWINVPADCVRPLRTITLHAARPAALNEPTAEGVAGSRQILEIVRDLSPRDVCIVLLSGGGSALLPAPAEGLTLEDKQRVTRLLMQGGATIHELNAVRKQLSQIKGGRLAKACGAGTIVTLIISDVIGDPLDVIASGPTVADTHTAAESLAILERFAPNPDDIPDRVRRFLEAAATRNERLTDDPRVQNHVIGNNAVALDAAATEARRRGYVVHSLGSNNPGVARDVGRDLAALCRSVCNEGRPVSPPACVLSGGEPVVKLAETSRPRRGGRNQEVALAALQELSRGDELHRITILSGGTDGEDGPTDAAGAIADADVLAASHAASLDPDDFLAINNAYEFFDRAGGLLKTGPTHTNVMDLRVALIDNARPK